MLIYGHRGSPTKKPENTIASFIQASKDRADGVEIDVRLCGSGEVICTHDRNLKRVSGQDIDVQETDWSEIKFVDVGTHLKLERAYIPSVSDAIYCCLSSNLKVILDVKTEEDTDLGLLNTKIRSIVRAFDYFYGDGREVDIVVSSASVPFLEKAEEWADTAFISELGETDSCMMGQHPSLERFLSDKTPFFEPIIWTVNTIEEKEKAINWATWGIGGMITDYPHVLANPLPKRIGRGKV